VKNTKKKKLDSKTFFLDGDETSNKITTTNKKIIILETYLMKKMNNETLKR
jgi:hypothetical protein